MENPITTPIVEDATDPLLEKLAKEIAPAADAIEASEEHALFVLGAKYIDRGDGDNAVETYTVASGFYSIIAEGFYTELSSQIESGNPAIFLLLSQVVKDLAEEYGIDTDELTYEERTLN